MSRMELCSLPGVLPGFADAEDAVALAWGALSRVDLGSESAHVGAWSQASACWVLTLPSSVRSLSCVRPFVRPSFPDHPLKWPVRAVDLW